MRDTASTLPTSASLLAAADALRARVSAAAEQIERDRRLSPELVTALADAGRVHPL